MSFASFKEILDASKEMEPKRLCIAAAEDKPVLESVKLAKEEGLNLQFTLVGDQGEINKLGEELSLPLDDMKIISASTKKESAKLAVQEASGGEADFLMKGLVSTKDFLKEVLNEEYGLRTGNILSHLGAFDVPNFSRILFMTDGGINPAPSFEDKQQILENSIAFVNDLGVKDPKAAVLAAVETVNPKMEATLDASNLSKMQERGQIKGAQVDGPLALDNAIDKQAAEHKGIGGSVAGSADILLVPDIESGNLFGKTITFLSGGTMAGIVLGAKVPVVLTSRADNEKTKMTSMALGALAVSS